MMESLNPFKDPGNNPRLNVLFTIYLALIPFAIGPTTRYLFSLATIALSWHILLKERQVSPSLSLAEFIRSPLGIFLAILNLFALFSVFFSPNPAYSLKVFFEDFFLNTVLFGSVAILVSNCPNSIRWERSVITANALFLCAYLGLMLQWVVFPSSPLFPWADQIQGPLTRWEAVFAFGNGCRVFHGIKHTSLFLTLVIAFWTVKTVFGRLSLKEICIFLLDLFTLLTTTRRGAILAVVSGFAASQIFFRKTSKPLVSALLFIAALGTMVVVSGNMKHFVREDWQLILKGEIEKARQLGGSIPLRVSTYRTFAREVIKDPLRPRGLGKKLIKEYRPKLVKEAGLLHGHNTLLNFAYYMGVQGALALSAIICIQAWLFIRCLKKGRRAPERTLMATALIFMLMFWGTNMVTDGFLHGSATMYWLFTAVPTGVAMGCKPVQGNAAP